MSFIACTKSGEKIIKEDVTSKPDTKSIVGGAPINITYVPYQARIIGTYGGGGVILTDRWILTAAHVVANDPVSALTIYVGSNDINSGDSYTADNIIIHENYGGPGVNDIALVHLSTPIVFGLNVKPIRFATPSHSISINQIGQASGWGATEAFDTQGWSTVLKAADLRVDDISDPSYFIARGTSLGIANEGVCFGDSGGPFTAIDPADGNRVLIGITSTTYGLCSTGFCGFTNVGYYYNWIFDKIKVTIDIYNYAHVETDIWFYNQTDVYHMSSPANATESQISIPEGKYDVNIWSNSSGGNRSVYLGYSQNQNYYFEFNNTYLNSNNKVIQIE